MAQAAVVPIVFSSDDNYAPYLGVAIRSLIDHISPETRYEIYVIDGGISDENKQLIESLKTKNVAIAFVDIQPYIKDLDLTIFTLNSHFTIATYYRFFLPQMFGRFDKVLYLDCDITVLKDVKELFDIDIGDNYLGAANEIVMYHPKGNEFANYAQTTLNINPQEYFCAGVLIVNLSQMRLHNVTDQLFAKLQVIKNPRFVDQCILNAVCNGHIRYIPIGWNMVWFSQTKHKNNMQKLLSPFREEVIAAVNDPYIIHYASKPKPWHAKSPDYRHWWQYALQTPFYSTIFAEYAKFMSTNSAKFRKKYIGYKLLSLITIGKTRKRSKRYAAIYKERIEELNALARKN